MGQLVAPAEHRRHGHRSAESMGDPQQRSHRSTKSRTGKEDGDDLTAPEARSQGDSGKENFQQEGLGDSLAGQHGADDGVSCSVVGLLSHQQGEQQHQHAAHRRRARVLGSTRA